MSTTSTSASRIAAARSRMHSFDDTTESRVHKKEKQEVEEIAAPGIAENPFYKIVMDTSTSTDQKISSIAKYLTAENGNYDDARKKYAEFEAYFNFVQSQNLELNTQGIQRLIKELEGALKAEIEKIVTNVMDVQKGVDESRKLLEVLRTARVEGKTIDQISDAIKINDALIAEMTGLQANLDQLVGLQKSNQSSLSQHEQEKVASETGFINKAKRLFGPDKSIEAAIEDAQDRIEEMKEEMTKVNAELEAKKASRNVNLESGPLLVLRSIDATEKSFSESIINTAKNSLALIDGATKSIQKLITRITYSEATAREINHSIAEAEVRQTILKGAIQQVSKATTQQITVIKAELDEKDAQIAAATKGDVQYAVLNADRVDIDQRHNGSLDYQEVLNQTETNFEVIAAGNVEAKSSANQLSALIHTEKELLKRLGTEALPATALALRTVLETCVAQQNGEMAITIGAITQRARETGKSGLANLMTAQAELHDQKIKDMDRAIQALADAEESVVQRIETTVAEGVTTRQRMKSLVEVAAGLQGALGDLNEIRPSVSATEESKS